LFYSKFDKMTLLRKENFFVFAFIFDFVVLLTSSIQVRAQSGLTQVRIHSGSTKVRVFELDRVRETFLLDGIPFRFISGSIHNFRVPAAYWNDRFRKIRAGGFNAVQVGTESKLLHNLIIMPFLYEPSLNFYII
jgi:hypothetical protein